MKNQIIKEVHKKWEELGKNNPQVSLELEIDLYKRLLNIFQVGPCFYLIFNPAAKRIEYISNNVTEITGYELNEVSLDKYLDVIHPDDLPYYADFEVTVIDFKKQLPIDKLMKYKSRYNYRLRKKDGKYIYVLHQSITIQVAEDGSVLRNLTFITDISDISQSNKMKLSLIGIDGEPSYIDIKYKSLYSKSKELFTPREKDILALIIEGKNSEEIADILSISIHTVRNHRKNILSKSGCNNVNELLVAAVKESWI